MATAQVVLHLTELTADQQKERLRIMPSTNRKEPLMTNRKAAILMASPKLAALELISSARLEPTEHLLLKHFVEGAVDPDRAAQYLLSSVDKSPNQDVGTYLQCFKKDWRNLVTTLTTLDLVLVHLDDLVRRRDGPYCCIRSKDPPEKGIVTMSEPAYIIPPSMFANIDLDKEGRIHAILDAFLSPLHIAKLRALLQSHANNDEDMLRNLWLLSPSIHKAFRGGHVNVEARGLASKIPETEQEETDSAPEYIMRTLYPEEPSNLVFGNGTCFQNSRQNFKCSAFESTGLNPPNRFLFAVHHKFSAALHLFYIEDKIARGWPRHRLVRAGRWLYGSSIWQDVQRVPFGLVIKDSRRSYENEANALRLVAHHTSVPAPRIIDTGVYGDKNYLVMSRLPGQMLGDVLHLMSYAERDRFDDKLGACLEQIRQIPNTAPYLLCDTLGGRLSDHRIPGMCGGPFNTEDEFNDHLTSHMGCSAAVFFGEQTSPPRDHSIYFTHSDFHRTNLLVDQGQLSGIVDWECAGYKPEYWEYTKAVWTSLRDPILEALFRRAFAQLGSYGAELEAERKLWRYTPFGV
ncbi:hypothetical protein V493_01533 [Pseudogymnoascus sp. VKM F-4281 (FW-2241)]|nr:hypothetical protein V493_01533 [Pseudogymnoascus sp. VKM F-4281 (FW-2241)]